MITNAQLSEILTTHLELSIFPVAVSLYPKHDLELEKYRPGKPLKSYCHGVMTAAQGQALIFWKKISSANPVQPHWVSPIIPMKCYPAANIMMPAYSER